MELMPEFKLHRPETVSEAVRLNGGSETARYLAGGTDMVVNIRRGIEAPETLIDLNGVKEMTGIREDADGLHIGAAVKLQDLGAHASVQRDYAAVAEAAPEGRSVRSLLPKATRAVLAARALRSVIAPRVSAVVSVSDDGGLGVEWEVEESVPVAPDSE